MRVLSTGTGPVRRAPFPHGPIAEVLVDEHAGAGQPAAGYVTVPPGGGMADHAYGEPTALVVPLTGELLISGSGAAHQGKVTVGVVVLLDQGGAAPASIDRLRQDHVRVAEAPGRGRRGEIVDVITQQQLAALARLPGGYRASASGWARAEHWYLLTEGPLIDLDQLRPDQADDAVLNRLTHLRAGEHVELHIHGDPRRLWRRLQRRAPGAYSWSERRDDDRGRGDVTPPASGRGAERRPRAPTAPRMPGSRKDPQAFNHRATGQRKDAATVSRTPSSPARTPFTANRISAGRRPAGSAGRGAGSTAGRDRYRSVGARCLSGLQQGQQHDRGFDGCQGVRCARRHLQPEAR